MSILKSIKTKTTEIKNKAEEWVVENEDMAFYALGIVVGASAGAAIMGLHKDLKFAGILDKLNSEFISKSNLDIYPMLNTNTNKAGLAVFSTDIFGKETEALIEVTDPNDVASFADSLKNYAMRAGATVESAAPEATKTIDVAKELDKVLESVDCIKKAIV